MQGKIIRGIGGFYYVHAQDGEVYECRAKGIFRREGIKPLVGDNVEISMQDGEQHTGNVDRILPRRNELTRPAAANVDQAIIMFAVVSPEPNLNLLDRFLVMMELQAVPVMICFNKTDLATGQACRRLVDIYRSAGYEICLASIAQGTGIGRIRSLLQGKTTVAAGPSGVGKSSLTNALQPEAAMEVGDISRKLGRGRHTTRHTELLVLPKLDETDTENTYFLDTPGFSSLYLRGIDAGELWRYFPEFVPCEPECRFQGCSHINEPGCAVRAAVQEGRISRPRYEDYVQLWQELKNTRKY